MINFVTDIMENSLENLPQFQQLLRIPVVGERLKEATKRKNLLNIVDQGLDKLANYL